VGEIAMLFHHRVAENTEKNPESPSKIIEAKDREHGEER
jgi:hypothetical protein